MAPLRTAATTAALRLATQRFVSAGGKSTVVQSVHSKILPSVNRSVFSSCAFAEDFGKARDTSDSNEDYHRSRFGEQNRRFELDYALGLRPFLVSTFCPFTESIDDRGYRLKKICQKIFWTLFTNLETARGRRGINRSRKIAWGFEMEICSVARAVAYP
jgi:hypothetical protein